jgi:hypothetical protein
VAAARTNSNEGSCAFFAEFCVNSIEGLTPRTLDRRPLRRRNTSASRSQRALLDGDPTLTPLEQLLVRRGNPFFLEEMVRTLVETNALAGERGQYRLTQPVQAFQNPVTVQARSTARKPRSSSMRRDVFQTLSGPSNMHSRMRSLRPAMAESQLGLVIHLVQWLLPLAGLPGFASPTQGSGESDFDFGGPLAGDWIALLSGDCGRISEGRPT